MIPRAARRGSLIFLLSTVFVVLVLLYRSRLLFGLLFEDGSRDTIRPFALPEAGNENATAVQLIPKIIHQTYKTEDIPSHWRPSQQAVKDLHPDYEYMFWTDAAGLTFIATHYPTFFPTYESYPYDIQRADALRYFLLHHYGGIYMDLDLSPYRSLTPLLQYPAFACVTSPTGISNDILGSVPGHPFYALVGENLASYARNWGSKYVTVMYSTGPLFLSVLWIQYLKGMGSGGVDSDRMRVLVPDNKEGDGYGFLKNVQGGSWHGEDTEMIFWMGRHWIVVTIVGFVIGFSVTWIFWSVFRRLSRMARGERCGERKTLRKVGRYKDLV